LNDFLAQKRKKTASRFEAKKAVMPWEIRDCQAIIICNNFLRNLAIDGTTIKSNMMVSSLGVLANCGKFTFLTLTLRVSNISNNYVSNLLTWPLHRWHHHQIT
jgi:hypothetical protein